MVPPRAPSVVYYYIESTFDGAAGRWSHPTPYGGARTPLTLFISQNHLGDMDLNGDLLDSFDLIRLVRHVAWREALPFADRIASAGIGDHDIELAAEVLRRSAAGEAADDDPKPLVAELRADDRVARVVLADRSTMTIPRGWHQKISDVDFSGPLASSLMSPTAPFWALGRPPAQPNEAEQCAELEGIAVNKVFYRLEPHLLRRYLALAADNIERMPAAFAAAAAYRALRLFVIIGSDDRQTVQQFGRSRIIYSLATLASCSYAALFAIGVVIAWRRGSELGLPLLLILYVPLTIAPMLTNMRYTVTMQPLMFMFVGVAITTAVGRGAAAEADPAALDRAGT
jgi:hypothetical protein